MRGGASAGPPDACLPASTLPGSLAGSPPAASQALEEGKRAPPAVPSLGAAGGVEVVLEAGEEEEEEGEGVVPPDALTDVRALAGVCWAVGGSSHVRGGRMQARMHAHTRARRLART